MAASLREPRPPIALRRRRPPLLSALVASCLPLASFASPLAASSASPLGWGFASAKSLANARRRSEEPPFGKRNGHCGFGGRGGGPRRSDVLDEFDLEEDDYFDSGYDGSDDESVLWTSEPPRGGATVGGGSRWGGAASRFNLPNISSGLFDRRNNNGENRSRRKITRQRQIMQQLEATQRQKLRLIRSTFRQKQRQFQTSLYNLNSRLNHGAFPRPPYSLWRIENEPSIGKTTLTGKIFLFNIAAFGLQTLYPQLTAWGAKRSDMILEGRQLYRLLTPIFLHGGIGHLMANSYSLKSMGINVERAFGQPRLLATYLASGVMGNVVSAIQSPNPAVGASGAIFGLVGAYYTFLSRNGDLFGRSGEMQKSALIETIGFNLLLGMTNPMIDNWGHAGGFIGGVGMAYLIGPKLYVARVPLGDDHLGAGGFGAGRVVVDRPTLAFRVPEFVDEGFFWVKDNLQNFGRRAKRGVRGLLNSRGEQEYYLDRDVDYGTLGLGGGDGDGTIYRTLREDVPLGGSVHVTPGDGFRQDASELDPTAAGRRPTRRRRSTPKAGRSLRPRYGHFYR